MKVEWKGLDGARFYRGITLSGVTEVTDEWFEACKNENIVEVKRRGRPPNKPPEINITAERAEPVTNDDHSG